MAYRQRQHLHSGLRTLTADTFRTTDIDKLSSHFCIDPKILSLFCLIPYEKRQQMLLSLQEALLNDELDNEILESLELFLSVYLTRVVLKTWLPTLNHLNALNSLTDKELTNFCRNSIEEKTLKNEQNNLVSNGARLDQFNQDEIRRANRFKKKSVS